MTEAEPDARAALAAVNVELLDVIPAGELTTRYPSALTRSRRAVQSKEGSQVAILRCSRAGIFSGLMDCGETWAVGVVQDRLAIIGKRPSRPDPRFRSAAWLCPKGENFATTLWRPCNGRHFRTGLGDRATSELGRLLAAPKGSIRPPGSRSPYLPKLVRVLQQHQDGADRVPTQATLAAEVGCSPRTIRSLRPQALEILHREAAARR